jgi:hypothetical protein
VTTFLILGIVFSCVFFLGFFLMSFCFLVIVLRNTLIFVLVVLLNNTFSIVFILYSIMWHSIDLLGSFLVVALFFVVMLIPISLTSPRRSWEEHGVG